MVSLGRFSSSDSPETLQVPFLQCVLLSSSVCSSVCSSMLCIPLKLHKHGRIAKILHKEILSLPAESLHDFFLARLSPQSEDLPFNATILYLISL
jgi:hypothetical protein